MRPEALFAAASQPAAGSLLRLSWAWGLLLVVGIGAGILLAMTIRQARRLARPAAAPKAAPPRVDAWAESARRLRPDDPGAPRERGAS